ncbi:uncharacterized protein LOC100573874 isoform X2 [Acyrthosiphon pisum]|uniref:Uncharacterized protein n=1 Tax=Acyrthosiphon pisum TaxID=7029 RepID=A0A8R2A685_ACYPI|nr:uncharacterized protein LOC100573874 isoform X2 [Acyrthosiphon pisum]|eukprot:XP_003246311.1 PREDICTED: uncharacterized protein LOC100573874 isoform X2 [Acyrthosiphon pisum]
MKPFGVCFLFTSYLTVIIVTESVQEKNVQQYSDTFLKDLPLYYCRPPLITDDGVVERTCKITFSADIPQSAKARARAASNIIAKRGNQFKNFMLGKDTSKDVGSRVQKGSYIPVKSSGKRDDSTSTAYGIYTGPSEMDIFQKWLSSFYLQ